MFPVFSWEFACSCSSRASDDCLCNLTPKCSRLLQAHSLLFCLYAIVLTGVFILMNKECSFCSCSNVVIFLDPQHAHEIICVSRALTTQCLLVCYCVQRLHVLDFNRYCISCCVLLSFFHSLSSCICFAVFRTLVLLPMLSWTNSQLIFTNSAGYMLKLVYALR